MSDEPGSADRAVLRRLGLQLRVLRTARELSQEDVATAAGLDRSYVSRIERGAHNMTVLTLARLAEVLEVPVGELLDSAWDTGSIGRRYPVSRAGGPRPRGQPPR